MTGKRHEAEEKERYSCEFKTEYSALKSLKCSEFEGKEAVSRSCGTEAAVCGIICLEGMNGGA